MRMIRTGTKSINKCRAISFCYYCCSRVAVWLLQKQQQHQLCWGFSSSLRHHHHNNHRFGNEQKYRYYSTNNDLKNNNYNSDDDDDGTKSTTTTNATTGTKYSNLPRLYVGEIPTQPIPWSHRRKDLLQRQSSSLKPLFQDSILSLSTDQSHYILSVMRLTSNRRSGDHRNSRPPAQIRLFDGSGEEWLAEILSSSSAFFKESIDQHKQKRRKVDPIVQVQCRSRLSFPNNHDDCTTTFNEKQNRHYDGNGGGCWLFMAPPKLTPGNKDRMRWLIEKTTELGSQGYLWLTTDHTSSTSTSRTNHNKKQPSKKNNKFIDNGNNNSNTQMFQKLYAYAIEASEQCERLSIPQFVYWNQQQQTTADQESNVETKYTVVTPLEEIWKLFQQPQSTSSSSSSSQPNLKLFICRERGQNDSSIVPVWKALDQVFMIASLSSDNEKNNNHPEIAFVIGPEGGWSQTEQQIMDQLAQKQPQSIYQVSLGEHVLRVETAAAMAVGAYALHKEFHSRHT